MHMLTAALLALALSGQLAPHDYAQHEPLALRSAAPNATEVPCYGLFSLKLDLSVTCDNPFDPGDVDVWAVFRAPDQREIRVSAFLNQPCRRWILNDTAERIETDGAPFWEIRFSPTVPGAWQYTVYAKDRSGQVVLPETSFTATPSPSPGYIRTDRRNPAGFASGDGQPFFAIGENMCWPGPRGTYDYDDWLPALHQGGGNWIRFWMYRWNCGLEWTQPEKTDIEITNFAGLGRYNLCNAWKLDYILDQAEANGIYVMLCLGTYGELTDGGFFNEGMWSSNPYNAATGGPCAKPEDFWTDATAQQLYRQRLRYIAARYGWRTNIFAWEFWNEAHAPAEWVAGMAQYLKGLASFEGRPADPFHHLVSTTYGTPEIWQLPEVDFTMTHHYGKGDIPDSAPIIHDDAVASAVYGKPHLMAEFGIDWRSSDDKYDPKFTGVNLHNGLWASALSGNAGTAMIWYWDSYVHPGKLYSQFTAIRRFTDRIPWHESPWNPIDAEAARADVTEEQWSALPLPMTGDFEKDPVAEHAIAATPGAEGAPLPRFLFGTDKPDMRVPLVLKVGCETAGQFQFTVDMVSRMARLQVTLDGAPVFDRNFDATPPGDPGKKPEYESTEFKKEYGIYQAQFKRKESIDLPPGPHTITLDVTDGDWLSLSHCILTHYLSNRYPRLNLYGITNGTKAYLWAQNANHNWEKVRAGVPIAPITGARTVLHGLAPGRYRCTWSDTLSGAQMREDTLTGDAGGLPLALPDIATDVAAAIEALSGP